MTTELYQYRRDFDEGFYLIAHEKCTGTTKWIETILYDWNDTPIYSDLHSPNFETLAEACGELGQLSSTLPLTYIQWAYCPKKFLGDEEPAYNG